MDGELGCKDGRKFPVCDAFTFSWQNAGERQKRRPYRARVQSQRRRAPGRRWNFSNVDDLPRCRERAASATMRSLARGASGSMTIGAALVISGRGAASGLSTTSGRTVTSMVARAVGRLRPDLFGQSPLAPMAIMSGAFVRSLSRMTGATESALTSSAGGQTTSWPAVGYPIADKVIELDGKLVKTITLNGRLLTEVDLSKDDLANGKARQGNGRSWILWPHFKKPFCLSHSRVARLTI